MSVHRAPQSSLSPEAAAAQAAREPPAHSGIGRPRGVGSRWDPPVSPGEGRGTLEAPEPEEAGGSRGESSARPARPGRSLLWWIYPIYRFTTFTECLARRGLRPSGERNTRSVPLEFCRLESCGQLYHGDLGGGTMLGISNILSYCPLSWLRHPQKGWSSRNHTPSGRPFLSPMSVPLFGLEGLAPFSRCF